MKKKKRSITQILFYFVAGLVALSIITTGIIVISQTSDYFKDEAHNAALKITESSSSAVVGNSLSYTDNIKKIANSLPASSDYNDIQNYGEDVVSENGYVCLQFLLNGDAIYHAGNAVGDLSMTQVQNLINSGKTEISDIFFDSLLGGMCVAGYTPVSGRTDIDGVLAYTSANSVYSGIKSKSDIALFYALCDRSGSIIESYSADNFKSDVSHNAFTYLYNISDRKDQYDEILSSGERGIASAIDLTVDGENYIAAVVPALSGQSGFTVVCVYEYSALMADTYPLYDRIIGVMILLVIMALFTVIIAVVLRMISKREVTIIDELDPLLGCNSFNKFIQEAQLITERNRFSKFAICYTSIKNYDYLSERCDKSLLNELLAHISNVLHKSIQPNETYGHIVDDHFLYMIHYTDVQNLGDKIKIINALISYFDKMKNQGYAVTILTGAFLTRESGALDDIGNVKYDINDCINKAKIASLANAKANDKAFVVYDATIGSVYTADAEIESRMRGALENKEFRLFFQPKYNISQRNIDSAEVLIRWYNKETETYQSPVSFIHIFETNGFIIELDHYVFRESCNFLREMKEQGQKTVPLSINVSRVTAIESGFVEFYRNVKREYGIPDGYITLEFTETFAYDSYSTLSELVIQLKQCGFLCSIDDFGVDCSALNILKELPVDEIKIDKQLLQTGHDAVKDRIILEGIFGMANKLGLKLIQEGVETKEELDYINQLGCNIIQGYYYSKALFMTDFIDFINDSKLTKMFLS